ncbi:putative Thioredoxin, mitochondrial [Hypsibius exemplaris]|uniref:Thioredoxin, mitochondrial n=1 Tax=Hypsibius exemplaris TaxID=2072580 RepID=A0A1W0XAW9_HYPEX|nr:putative Thioredoxin, mitochondrial [Hypsibius exemplaris]
MASFARTGIVVARALQNPGLFQPSALIRGQTNCSGLIAVRSLHTSRVVSAASSSSDKVSAPIFNIQDEEDFKKRVIGSSTPVIVDFHATWCGPCKILGPRLEALISAQKGKVLMAKVDIDEQSELANEYQVRSIPTVFAFKNGKVVDQFIGLADDDKVSGMIDKLLAR